MAWTAHQPTVGNNSLLFSAASTATTYTFSGWTNYAPLAGDIVVVSVCGNHTSGSSLTAVSDNSGNPGAANVWSVVGPAEGSSTLSQWIAYCTLTRAFSSGTTLSVVSSGVGASRRAGEAAVWTPTVATATFDTSAIFNSVAASPISMASPGLAATGELVVASSAVRAGAAITAAETGTGFTLVQANNSGGITTVVSMGMGRHNNAGTAAVTSAQTYTAFTTGCGVLVAFSESTPTPDARSEIINVRRTWAGA